MVVVQVMWYDVGGLLDTFLVGFKEFRAFTGTFWPDCEILLIDGPSLRTKMTAMKKFEMTHTCSIRRTLPISTEQQI